MLNSRIHQLQGEHSADQDQDDGPFDQRQPEEKAAGDHEDGGSAVNSKIAL